MEELGLHETQLFFDLDLSWLVVASNCHQPSTAQPQGLPQCFLPSSSPSLSHRHLERSQGSLPNHVFAFSFHKNFGVSYRRPATWQLL